MNIDSNEIAGNNPVAFSLTSDMKEKRRYAD